MSISAVSGLVFLLIIGPQDRVSVDAPDGLTVQKASYEKVTFRPGWDEPRDPASNLGLQDVRPNVPRDNAVNTSGSTQPAPTSGRLSGERREQRKVNRSGNEAQEPATGPEGTVQQYIYQIRLLNSGDKPIEGIDWEYSIDDSDKTSGPRFQTFRRIKPATSSTLTGRSSTPPSRVVSARTSSAATLPARVVIRCVLYSDGTVSWRVAASERDCDGLRNRTKRS